MDAVFSGSVLAFRDIRASRHGDAGTDITEKAGSINSEKV